MIEFPKDFKEFLQLLNSNKIEYLVIGGYAVGYHGYPRATGDLDILIAVNKKTALKMVGVLKAFGFNLPELRVELFLTKENVIRMGIPPMRLEIFTTIDGVDFESCFKNRVVADLGDLLINKRSSGRPQDLVDFNKLQNP